LGPGGNLNTDFTSPTNLEKWWSEKERVKTGHAHGPRAEEDHDNFLE
jgi:hypothetical protein